MAIVEIQLNRLGINSLEVSTDSVDVSAGTSLHVRIVNHGSPTHATLRCEGAAYTDFTYENIYVEGESEQEIKIKESAGSGSFDMQVITGYGMRLEAFTINVIKSCPAPSPEPVIFPTEPEQKPKMQIGKSAVIAVFPILGILILLVWQFVPLLVDGIIMAVILYLVMLAGVIVAWRLAQ